MTQVPEWRRPKQVMAEIKKAKLSEYEATRLRDLMIRFRTDRTLPKDHKRLRDGVEELRLFGDRRDFRLYFGRVESGLVLLLLHFKAKKKDSDGEAIDLAADRLKRWRDQGDVI